MDKENNNDIDLSKSFGSSSNKPQGGTSSSPQYFRPGSPKIVQLIMRYSGGLVKNERQAFYVVLGFIIIAFIISIILIFSRERGGSESTEIFTPPANAPLEELVPR